MDSLKDPAKQAELRAKGYGFYASGALESLTKLTYDEIVDQEIGFIGTPEKVISQVRALEAKGGIGELAIVSNFGGLEHWKSIKTQELFAKHVIPNSAACSAALLGRQVLKAYQPGPIVAQSAHDAVFTMPAERPALHKSNPRPTSCHRTPTR